MKISEIFEGISRRSIIKSLPLITALNYKAYSSEENNGLLKPKNPKIFNDKEFVKKVFEELKKEYLNQYRIDITKKLNNKSLPTVKLTYEADEKTVESIIGTPVDTKKYPINFYDYKNNIIYLSPTANVGSLVHELVHYVQYNITNKGKSFDDFMEQEAIKFQHLRNWNELL